MSQQKVFTLSEVSQHKSRTDCWFIINGRVLNVTKFLEEHPGGEEVLIEAAGKDATKDFKDIGHSKAAHNLLLKYQVGILQGYNFQNEDVSSKYDPAGNKESKTKEMTAFVIKEEGLTKYAAFLEFFIPLLVAVSFFGYRFLTREALV
ncbi:Cytochrome b5-like heme/steroid binding domain [Dillenia turbinata]|uniref:Cytochrome b5-like heme/steroid binding domain n=1 Tax=Dillenia turbinata TaxID=194707 RepID=A0AAN8VRC0_9MAGN